MGEGKSHSEPIEVGLKPPLLKAPYYTIKEVFNHKFLIKNLVTREVRGKYRNAMLSYTWTFIEPALLAVVYYFLFFMLAGNPDELYSVCIDRNYSLGMFQ